uniref:ATP synthase F0 subunit 8 n=1 Tax=Plenaster craigi TaxID=2021432 RepID=A0A291L4J5_9METZ|nr:ATP synthase F0 subunit 8 [Plenaster craigi]
MPQLETVTYLTQYIWTLIMLLILFLFLVNIILPKLQQQLAIRSKISSVQLKARGLPVYRAPSGSITPIFKALFSIPSGLPRLQA